MKVCKCECSSHLLELKTKMHEKEKEAEDKPISIGEKLGRVLFRVPTLSLLLRDDPSPIVCHQ